MSGHSKWATTHRAKSAADAKRGAVFTKLIRGITIAARGGADPAANFKLRLAVDQARAVNMPKDTIERAIARGSGGSTGEQLEAVTYEGFGPHGVAVIMECLTDNRNRTSQEIRHLVEEHGGSMGAPGSVSWQFARIGIVNVPTLTEADELALIDLGATDVERSADGVRIACPPDRLESVRQHVSDRGLTPRAQLTLQPKETVTLADQAVTAVQKFLTAVAGHPDVHDIHHNANHG